jgi:hypothetical protein
MELDLENFREEEEKKGRLHDLQAFTFTFEATPKGLVDGFLRGLEGMLAPGLAIVRAEDCHFTLLSTQGGKVWNFDDHGAAKKR